MSTRGRGRWRSIYFGSDGADQRKVLTGTVSGNVMINGTIMHVAQDDLPFGGVGP